MYLFCQDTHQSSPCAGSFCLCRSRQSSSSSSFGICREKDNTTFFLSFLPFFHNSHTPTQSARDSRTKRERSLQHPHSQPRLRRDNHLEGKGERPTEEEEEEERHVLSLCQNSRHTSSRFFFFLVLLNSAPDL